MSEAQIPADQPIFQPPTLEELALLLPQYEMEGFIAQGGMGAVYLARQPTLDRHVAIKVLPAEMEGEIDFVERFQIEARAMAKLQHGNIVSVYDFGITQGGHLYLVMEYINGDTLHNLIHSGVVTAEHALSYALQLCDALQYAHDHGIIHRDIKPSNVLINTEGRVKVADFGLARPTAAHEHEVMMGTPDYAAPEIMQGVPVDHRADIFALGVLIYEMLTRTVPKKGVKPASHVAGVDAGWDDIITKATRVMPKDRYQHVKEMRVALSLIANRRRYTTPGGGMRPGQRRHTVQPARGGGMTSFMVGLMALLVITMAGLYLWPLLKAKIGDRFNSKLAKTHGVAPTPDHSKKRIMPNPPDTGDDGPAPRPLNIDLAKAETGHLVKYPRGHRDMILGLALLPSQQRVLSVSADQTMKLWRVMTGELLQTVRLTSPVLTVAVSPDGRLAATGSAASHVKLWDLESAELKGEVESSGKIAGILFSPSGNALVVASIVKEQPVQLWNIADGAKLQSLTGWTLPVTGLCAIPGSREESFITTGGRPRAPGALEGADMEIGIGSFQHSGLVKVLKPGDGFPGKVAVSPDGRLMAFSAGRTVEIIDLGAESTVATCKGHASMVSALQFLDGGRLLITGSDDQSLRIWETATGEEVWRAALDDVHATNSLVVNSDETVVISAGGFQGIRSAKKDDEFPLHLWKLPVLASLKTSGVAVTTKKPVSVVKPATPPPVGADTELDKLKEQFEAEWIERVTKASEAALGKLDSQYTKALQTALATASPADRISIQNEIARVTNKGPVPAAPDSASPVGLQRLVRTYIDQITLIKQKESEVAKAVLAEQTGKLAALETQRQALGDEKGATRAKSFADEWIKTHAVNDGKQEGSDLKSAS